MYLTEHQEQCLFMSHVYMLHNDIYEYLAAVPNGALRNKIVAIKLKKEGVKKGYPDLLLDYPSSVYHGLRIEMKRVKAAKPSVSKVQRDWLSRLNKQGYCAVVAHGCDDALDILKRYLNNEKVI